MAADMEIGVVTAAVTGSKAATEDTVADTNNRAMVDMEDRAAMVDKEV